MGIKTKFLYVSIGCLSLTGFAHAQQKQTVGINFSADLVSSYVWRGIKQAGASVQPALGISYGGLSLGSWASTDLAGNDKKEVDFSLSYSLSGLSVCLTDYWWDGEYAGRYFSSPRAGNAGHLLEAGLSYTFARSFPLSISWNTFVLGNGNKKADGKNSFSTYVQAAYPFRVKEFDCWVAAGFIPWQSVVYGPAMDGFKFTVLNLRISKQIAINDRIRIPLFAQLVANPAVEDMHFVFGFTIQ